MIFVIFSSCSVDQCLSTVSEGYMLCVMSNVGCFVYLLCSCMSVCISMSPIWKKLISGSMVKVRVRVRVRQVVVMVRVSLQEMNISLCNVPKGDHNLICVCVSCILSICLQDHNSCGYL